MLELIGKTLEFSFPEVHPGAKMSISFERTLRIPDDGKQYHLPPSLGSFPALKIDDLPEERIPTKWKEHGGILLPMYQSEAMWISFHPHYPDQRSGAYPFAVRIATGKISAISGKAFVKNMKENDYVVIPEQPWLDGFVVDDDFIRQFIAAPLGSGVSVEAQISGEDKIGGIQIEVIPMKNNIFNEKFPKLKKNNFRSDSKGIFKTGSLDDSLYCACASFDSNPDMSLAAGGKMKQKIEADPHGLDVWDVEHSSKVFVHLTNSIAWRAITGTEPPSIPLTAREYTQAGLPWFDYYTDGTTLKATEELKSIKSVKEIGGELPENESADDSNVKDLSSEV
jgi:hypothetical protein